MGRYHLNTDAMTSPTLGYIMSYYVTYRRNNIVCKEHKYAQTNIIYRNRVLHLPVTCKTIRVSVPNMSKYCAYAKEYNDKCIRRRRH